MEGKKLVAKIKSMVVSRGMSMTEFYKKSGITGGAMSQWKSGDTQPALSTLQRIADVLEATVSELVGTDEKSKNPATEDGSGRYGLTRAEWEQIGRIFYNKVYAIGKAPGWLASEQTGLSVGDVDDFLAGKRYVTKAQIHAMADRLGMSLWDVIGSYAQAFDGEEDEVIADRERLLQVAERLSPELLREAVRFLDIPAEDQESAAHDLALVNQVRRTRS